MNPKTPPTTKIITRVQPKKQEDLREFVRSGPIKLDSPSGQNNPSDHVVAQKKPTSVPTPPPPTTPPSMKPPVNVRMSDDPPAGVDSRYQRLDLPSRELPYLPETSAVFVRKITWTEYSKLYAAMKAQSTTALLDALDFTCSIPVRDLVVADYKYLLLWHRVNSFLKSPTNVKWRSIYGDTVESSVTRTQFTETKLKMSQEEFMAWRGGGLSLPTAREIEFFEALSENEGISDEEYTLLEHAQWLCPTHPDIAACIESVEESHPYRSLEGRVRYLKSREDFDLFYDIQAFKDAVGAIGITQSAKVVDTEFDRTRAMVHLKSVIDLEANTPGSVPQDVLVKSTQEFKRLSEDEMALPMEEEVTLVFSAWSMFPIDV